MYRLQTSFGQPVQNTTGGGLFGSNQASTGGGLFGKPATSTGSAFNFGSNTNSNFGKENGRNLKTCD